MSKMDQKRGMWPHQKKLWLRSWELLLGVWASLGVLECLSPHLQAVVMRACDRGVAAEAAHHLQRHYGWAVIGCSGSSIATTHHATSMDVLTGLIVAFAVLPRRASLLPCVIATHAETQRIYIYIYNNIFSLDYNNICRLTCL